MNKNTPLAKGVRTFLQVIAGFVIGLAVTVWAVPGVPQAVQDYVLANAGTLLLNIGVSTSIVSGLISFVQNKAEDRNK